MEQKRKNILVTGGYGFIGYNFIHMVSDFKKLDNIFHELHTSTSDLCVIGHIVNVDINNYAAVNKSFTPNGVINLEKSIGDVTLRDLVAYDIDVVVNFAAQTHVDNSIDSSRVFIQHNIVEFHKLLEVCKEYNKNKNNFRFIQVSTDEVYGSVEDNDGMAFGEFTPYHPNNPYSASKASAELILKSYVHTYDFPGIITNCSNNFGPGQHPEKMIPKIITNYLKEIPVPVYGDGKQRRDWLYVEDHCEGIWEVIENGKIGESYLFGTNRTITNLELVDIIHNLMEQKNVPGKGIKQFVKDRPGHDRTYQIDYSKSKNDLMWEPSSISPDYIKMNIDYTIDWYLNNRI